MSKMKILWKVGVVSVLGALLVGCNPPQVPSDARNLTVEEVKALYMGLPQAALPDVSEGVLGGDTLPAGKAVNWSAPASVPLYSVAADGKQVQNGVLLPDGTVQPATQTPLKVSEKLPLEQLLHLDGTYCPVNTLQLSSNPQAAHGLLDTFLLSAGDINKGIQPLTSPTIQWVSVGVDLRPYKGGAQWLDLWLVNVPETVTLKGEKQCIGGSVATRPSAWKTVEETQTIMNVRLQPGWNILLNKRTTLNSSVSLTVTKSEWQALPASALARKIVGSGYY